MVSDKVWTVEDAGVLLKRMGVYSAEDSLTGEEIGDGNLNYVFRLSDKKSGRSVIIKKAVPFLRVVGDTWPLTEERASIEAQALKFQARVAPMHVPALYAYSPDDHAIVMEDLSHLKVMRGVLNEGHQFPDFSGHIAHFLAQTLFWSSDRSGQIEDKKRRAAEMTNPELCRITEALIFTDPFYNAQTNHIEGYLGKAVEALWQDSFVLEKVFFLKDRFMTDGQALVHGDLHTGSIMVGAEETRVIDPEFAFYGPMGFDVGLLLANLFLNMLGHTARKTSKAHIEYLRRTAQMVWIQFAEEFAALWRETSYDGVFHTSEIERTYLRGVLRDARGYAGCEMIRRTIGLAQVSDLTLIVPEGSRRNAQEAALGAGRDLIKEYEENEDIDSVLAVVDHWITEMEQRAI